jgi:hypothetical protein
VIVDVNAADLLDVLPGGSDMHLSMRTDAGAWTDVPTRRPFIFPVFDAVDTGATGDPMFGRRTLPVHTSDYVIT